MAEKDGKKLCKLCDSRIHAIQNLGGIVSKLKDDRAALVLAVQKCIELIDKEVSDGKCNRIYSLIRNTLNHELYNLGIGTQTTGGASAPPTRGKL